MVVGEDAQVKGFSGARRAKQWLEGTMRIFGAYEAFPKGSKALHLTNITVSIGKPIYFKTEDIEPTTRDTYQHLSDRVMEAIAALKSD